MMRRICKFLVIVFAIVALLGATSAAQAATTRQQQAAYTFSRSGVVKVEHNRHRHHHHRHPPKRLRAYRWAVTQRNKPYIWGGTGPDGYDCSGLVWKAYRKLGIHLPRTTYDMLYSSKLVQIPEKDAKKGDLAFYGSGHVEFFVNRDRTFGAANPVDGIGWHDPSIYWFPDMFFRVRHAG